ncbi:MAG: pyridoxamine 5'-phosphate oxidase family protein [Rhizobacter sp.]|nr:pyridoxamine 5'-phosphate oxidase family protein [Burkholderiales bacterium]
MKIEPQSSDELTRLSKLVEGMSVAMMTTVDDDDALVSRPMSPLEMDSHGAMWFFTDLRSEKIEHLRSVNLSFSDADKSTYVSISGRGEVHAEQARIDQLWTPFARPWFPDGKDSGNIALLKFVPSTAEYWDAPHSKMVRMFAMAASIVASTPIGIGDHDTLTGLSAAR